MHRELIDEALGYATIEPTKDIYVNSRHTWSIVYHCGSKEIVTEGSIRITIPHGFSVPQTTAFYEPGFTTVKSNKENLVLSVKIITDIFCRLDPNTGHSGAWGRNIFIKIEKGMLKEGDIITILYGNADYYGNEDFSKAGAWTRELSGKAEFIIAVDPNGRRESNYSGYSRILKSPVINILPGDCKKIKLIVPSNREKNDQRENSSKNQGHIIYIDEFNNIIKNESIFVKSDENEDYSLVKGNFINNQLNTIKSNPVLVTNSEITNSEPSLKLFWGDIHGHTENSDGIGSISEYLDYAENTSCLDFTAITDHDDIGPRLSDEEWEKTIKLSNDTNKPGHFITLIGYEYRNGLCDMNVYFPVTQTKENPINIECGLFRGTDGNFKVSKELTKMVKKFSGLIIPHMHFGADWSGFDENIYRVMEIYSQHGSAEFRDCPREIPYLRKQLQKSSKSNENCYFHEILNSGFKLGVTAGSDTHSARPGFSDWTRTSRTYLGGLTAVYANNLTRRDIWDSLYYRKCYATTGNRSILKFFINDAFMGDVINLNQNTPRIIRVICIADGQLEKINIFKNGDIFVKEPVSGVKMNKQYIDESFFSLQSVQSDWYYVRITLKNGEMIWSSPIWVNYKENI